MKGLLAFIAVTVGLTGSAHAYLKAGPVGYGHWLKQTTPQEGMTTSLAAAYSFRKVRSAYAGSAVQFRRVDNNALANVGFTAAGDFDLTAAAAHCAGTTCTIATWYDQSGLLKDAVRAAANQPAYIADCGNGRPCARATNGTQILATVATYTPVLPVSFSVVANRGGTGQCTWAQQYTAFNQVYAYPAVANSWTTQGGGGGNIFVTAADNAWHAGIGVIDGASSVMALDGTETVGTATGSVAAGSLVPIAGADTTTCSVAEMLQWGGYALTQPERQALAENQRQYWAPLPLDTFATPAAAYSMRRLKSTYSGPAIRLRRASDNAEQDINFLGFTGFTGAPIDTVAANAHCAATTCTVATWYDQSGNARHLTQATAGNQPALQFNCQNGLPCARMTVGTQQMTNTTVTASAVMTLNAVARHTVRGVGGPYCTYIGWGNQSLQQHSDFDLVLLNAVGGINAAATYQNWHSHTGVVNGAGSLIRVDATETPNALTGSGGGWAYFTGANTETCDHGELLAWDNLVLTAGERAALHVNQKSFWGF